MPTFQMLIFVGLSKKLWRVRALLLSGGVYKKKLNKNQHRSIILAKGGQYWIYEYLFAKNDRDNIDVAELNMFRLLATGYEGLGKEQLEQLIAKKHLSEICHGN